MKDHSSMNDISMINGRPSMILQKIKTCFTKNSSSITSLSLLIIALLLRLFDLGVKPYNFDESTYVYLASMIKNKGLPISLMDINNAASSSEMPLFSALLALAFKVLGESEGVARGISCVFSLLTIMMAHYMIKRTFGRYAGLLTLVLLTFDPILLRYSRVAQPYAMMTFFVLLALWLIIARGTSIAKLVLSGLVMGVAFSTKIIALVYFLASLLMLTIYAPNVKRKIFDVAVFTVSFAIVPVVLSCALMGDIFFYSKAIPIVLTVPLLSAKMGAAEIDAVINRLILTLSYFLFNSHHSVLMIGGLASSLFMITLRKNFSNKKTNNYGRTLMVLLFLYLIFNLALILLGGGVRHWEITSTIFLYMFLCPLVANNVLVAHTDPKNKRAPLKKVYRILMMSFIVAGLLQQIVFLPNIYLEEAYHDYWHIPTYRDVGLYIRNNSNPWDYIMTNTHAPVLRYYSNREAFYYFGFDPECQVVFLHMYYSYGTINAKYYVDLPTFLRLIRFIVIQHEPPQGGGITLSHSYVSVDDDFLSLINQYYRVSKVFYKDEQAYTLVYERKEAPFNPLVFVFKRSVDCDFRNLLRVIVTHKLGNETITKVFYSPNLPLRYQSYVGSSEIVYLDDAIALRTESALGTSAIGFSLTYLNIPLDEKFTINWSWLLQSNGSNVSADISLLIDGIWYCASFPSKFDCVEERSLSYTDVCNIVGYKPKRVHAVQFTLYSSTYTSASLYIYNLSISCSAETMEDSLIKEAKYDGFPKNVTLRTPISMGGINADFNVDCGVLQFSNSLWLRFWFTATDDLTMVIENVSLCLFDDNGRLIYKRLIRPSWFIPFTGTITDIPICVLFFPYEPTNKNLMISTSLKVVKGKDVIPLSLTSKVLFKDLMISTSINWTTLQKP